MQHLVKIPSSAHKLVVFCPKAFKLFGLEHKSITFRIYFAFCFEMEIYGIRIFFTGRMAECCEWSPCLVVVTDLDFAVDKGPRMGPEGQPPRELLPLSTFVSGRESSTTPTVS